MKTTTAVGLVGLTLALTATSTAEAKKHCTIQKAFPHSETYGVGTIPMCVWGLPKRTEEPAYVAFGNSWTLRRINEFYTLGLLDATTYDVTIYNTREEAEESNPAFIAKIDTDKQSHTRGQLEILTERCGIPDLDVPLYTFPTSILLFTDMMYIQETISIEKARPLCGSPDSFPINALVKGYVWNPKLLSHDRDGLVYVKFDDFPNMAQINELIHPYGALEIRVDSSDGKFEFHPTFADAQLDVRPEESTVIVEFDIQNKEQTGKVTGAWIKPFLKTEFEPLELNPHFCGELYSPLLMEYYH
ncbi:MAG: hypothetical protein WC254_00045 [Candidatus Woesearchaeota archaeon]|jgi:hypothetical protein